VLAACAPAATVPCADRIAPGELVITEVFARYKGAGGDQGRQWFEIFNATDRDLELAGLEIASGDHKHRIAQLAVAPHTFTTLGDDPPDQLPAYLDYGYGDELGTLADHPVRRREAGPLARARRAGAADRGARRRSGALVRRLDHVRAR